jgi:phenylacetate 2-hydroxylase
VVGIPEVPGALPFIGHLKPLGGRERKGDTVVFSRWGHQIGSDIFQIRLGSQRAIIVNTWPMIKELWLDQSSALADRSWQPGFIDKLGIDISSSPLTPTIKKCRGAAMKALGKPMWPSYYPLLEPSSVDICQMIHHNGNGGDVSVDLYPYFRQVIFDLSLAVTYGVRFGEIDRSMSDELLESLLTITSIRSSTEDYSHYVPILRIIPQSTTRTIEAEKRRRVILQILYDKYLDKRSRGDDVNCIVAQLGKERLTLEELHGTCVSLLQAAPDTVASGLYQACAWLCSPEGQAFQPEALADILATYNGDRDMAWKMAFREEKVPLVASLYKEALRCYSPTPFAQGRATVRDIDFRGIKIPKGITMIMNAQATNLSTDWFGPDAADFKPTRFLGNESNLPTLAFGAGSRQCPATNIGSRIMYAMLVRLILAFELKEAVGPGTRSLNLDKRDFSDMYGLVTVPRPFDCVMRTRDPTWLMGLAVA